MDLNLNGKRALVTGASGGIGSEIARVLSAERAQVVVHGRNVDRTRATVDSVKAMGGEAAPAIGDLATDEGAAAVVKAAREAFGGIDIVVNNAGGRSAPEAMRWFQIPLQEWLATFEMNVMAAARLAYALGPEMIERGWGRFIHIASGVNSTPTGDLPEYGVAKAGLTNMSLSLAKGLAFTGVTSNVISPGMTRTDNHDRWVMQVGKEQGLDDFHAAEAWILKNLVRQTVGRSGEPKDIANAVAYLASPVSDFITGINLRVDGGFSPSVN